MGLLLNAIPLSVITGSGGETAQRESDFLRPG